MAVIENNHYVSGGGGFHQSNSQRYKIIGMEGMAVFYESRKEKEKFVY